MHFLTVSCKFLFSLYSEKSGYILLKIFFYSLNYLCLSEFDFLSFGGNYLKCFVISGCASIFESDILKR